MLRVRLPLLHRRPPHGGHVQSTQMMQLTVDGKGCAWIKILSPYSPPQSESLHLHLRLLPHPFTMQTQHLRTLVAAGHGSCCSNLWCGFEKSM